jgi:hypothetical protein
MASRVVLPQHFPVVHHLEHRLLYRSFFRVGLINLDALERYLCPVTEEDLCEAAGYGGQVQAKGKVCQ